MGLTTLSVKTMTPTGQIVNYIWNNVSVAKTHGRKTLIDVLVTRDVFLSSADLSNYVPKHSVDFSAWQEHKHDDSVYQEHSTSQHTQLTEEVMVRLSVHQTLGFYRFQFESRVPGDVSSHEGPSLDFQLTFCGVCIISQSSLLDSLGEKKLIITFPSMFASSLFGKHL